MAWWVGGVGGPGTSKHHSRGVTTWMTIVSVGGMVLLKDLGMPKFQAFLQELKNLDVEVILLYSCFDLGG